MLMMPASSMAPVLIESWAMVRGLKQQGCTPGNTTEDMPGWRAVGGRDKQRALRERLPQKKLHLPLPSTPVMSGSETAALRSCPAKAAATKYT